MFSYCFFTLTYFDVKEGLNCYLVISQSFLYSVVSVFEKLLYLCLENPTDFRYLLFMVLRIFSVLFQ